MAHPSTEAQSVAAVPVTVPSVSFGEALSVWLRFGLLGFGGPAAQIAMMHKLLVDEKRWISERRFLHALNFCMLLPGPEAQQLATYCGWLLHGVKGGLAAGLLFVLPGLFVLLALSILYVLAQGTPAIEVLFFGIKCAVIAIVIEAVLRIGRRALKNRLMLAIAALAFIAIHFLAAPFPLIVLAAGLIGLVGARLAPEAFIPAPKAGGAQATDAERTPVIDAAAGAGQLQSGLGRSALVLGIGLPLWLGPVALSWLVLGGGHVFTEIGVFFSKMAVVTFGGAYAVLAYVAQQAVEVEGWLDAAEMLHGLAMAETTPGPLIMVLTFVGFLGGAREAGLDPLLGGLLGGLLTTWVTFAPCFLWIFLGGPYVERLHGKPALSGALSAITAAVVGVILNLALWFALHVLFTRVDTLRLGPLHILQPDLASLDPAALALAVAACLAMLRFHVGMIPTLAACAAAGAAWKLALL